MDEIVAYLRAHYPRHHADASMESLALIFGEFKLPDIYTVRKLPKAPWNDVGNREWFTAEGLDAREFITELKREITPRTGWLTVNGTQVSSMLKQFLEVELNSYQCISSIAYDAGMRFIEWAIRVTNGIDIINPDEALRTRPKTAAEELASTTVRLLGMRKNCPIVQTSPFRGDTVSVFVVPVRPELDLHTEPFLIDRDRAKMMCEMADRFDEFADKLDGYFVVIDQSISKLKTLRELAGSQASPHPLNRFLDSEMMTPYNTGILHSLFSRSREIADFLRMTVYCSFR